jgi:hypothetical protein
MTIRELFLFKAMEGDDIYIKVSESVWDGVLFDVDGQGITVVKNSKPDWLSFDDLEVWDEKGLLYIELNGKEQNCS